MPTQAQLTEFTESSYVPFLLALDQKLQQALKPFFVEYEVQDGRGTVVDLKQWLNTRQYVQQQLAEVNKKISFYFIFKTYTGPQGNPAAAPFHYDIKTALHFQAERYMITYGSKVLVSKPYGENLSQETTDKMAAQALSKSLKRIQAKAGNANS